MTLLEILVAVGILALISSLVYGAFDGLARSRSGMERATERHHQGRSALTRMSRELSSAFISLHRPLNLAVQSSSTLFVGRRERIDFTSFSHRRIRFGSHESDQNELSYFLSPDPETGAVDLVRREATVIDAEPRTGGVVQVLAQDVTDLRFEFLDPLTGQWVESWDSTQATGQLDRLPSQVRVEFWLRREDQEPLQMITKVALPMQAPLTFGLTQ
jgi:general secretion pathway protein J